jgi:putative GTP pyrophosphokinase
MNENEFIEKYNKHKPIYNAWGNIVKNTIIRQLSEQKIVIEDFLKIPVNVRLKSDASILTKAFFRKDKNYKNPYEDITDKVGIRFVVLELSQIETVKHIIEVQKTWNFSKDVDFDENCRKHPEIFGYQSVHYIVRNCNIINGGDIIIPAETPCEIQIRTLLQHAYAELSHQTVYKSNSQIDPMVKRKFARSMALIEVSDELFKEVRQDLKSIDDLYLGFVNAAKEAINFPNYVESLSTTIFDAYKDAIKAYSIDANAVHHFISEKGFLYNKVKENSYQNIIYEQPIIFLLFYLAAKYTSTLQENWPYDKVYLEPILTDLGISQ